MVAAVSLPAATLYWNDSSPASGNWGSPNWSVTADGLPTTGFTDGTDSAVVTRADAVINLAGATTREALGLTISSGARFTSATGGNIGFTVSGTGGGDLEWKGVTAGYFRLNLSLSSAWSGSLTDTSTNTLAGSYTSTSGNTGSAIIVGNTTSVGIGTKVALNGTGAFLLNTGTANSTTTIGELSGTSASAVVGLFNAGGGRKLRVEQSTNTTYAGRILTDNGGRQLAFEKAGSGRLRLTGGTAEAPGTWNNGTNVLAGSLYINGVTSGQSTYAVSDGATLGGTGTIGLTGTAAVTVASGGILDPGDVDDTGVVSAGTLTIGGDSTGAGLVFSGNATIRFSLGASVSDAIVLTGATMTGSAAGGAGSITFNFTNTGGVSAGQTFDLISFGGTSPGIVLSAFALSADSIAAGWGGTFSYGGDGNLLQFTVTSSPIPEPRTLALAAGLGCFSIGVWLRVRRRRACLRH